MKRLGFVRPSNNSAAIDRRTLETKPTGPFHTHEKAGLRPKMSGSGIREGGHLQRVRGKLRLVAAALRLWDRKLARTKLGVLGECMDESFLKEHAARCRRLAEKADEFTKRRLLDLAARYDSNIQPSRASNFIKAPVKPSDIPSERL